MDKGLFVNTLKSSFLTDFNQRLECTAPKCWSMYMPIPLHLHFYFIVVDFCL